MKVSVKNVAKKTDAKNTNKSEKQKNYTLLRDVSGLSKRRTGMRGLNYLCENDISDDDCLRCLVHGIKFACPIDCPDFKDGRKNLTEEQLEERDRLMKVLSVKDDPRWG